MLCFFMGHSVHDSDIQQVKFWQLSEFFFWTLQIFILDGIVLLNQIPFKTEDSKIKADSQSGDQCDYLT